MLTDHHCHLQDSKFFYNLDIIIKNADENGISKFIVCGTSEDDWQRVLDLSNKYPQIIPAIGIHPWFVEKITPRWQSKMEQILDTNPNCLVGEIGLDLHFCKDTIEKQQDIFTTQMEIAKKYNRQVSIHNLKSWHLLVPILKKFIDLKILLHSYSGSLEITKNLNLFPNIFYSFSGTILGPQKRSEKIISQIPFNKILLETDSPFLLPKYENIKNQEYNEPANLIFILKKMAKILKIDPDILKNQISENSIRYFKESLFDDKQ